MASMDVAMGLIAGAGDARSSCMEAIELAKEGKFQEAREALVLSLDHSIRRMAAAYELWDFGVWSPIIQSTVYEGLFCVGKAVLEGTFQAGELSWHRTGRNKERL